MLQTEFETKLNRTSFHIYVSGHYEEDYQMPMLRQNRIPGILEVEGCEVEGKSRYTYTISGLMSMKVLHEKSAITKEEMQEFVAGLLEVTGKLQEYMLNPDCLVLEPDCIFYKSGQWFFCYLPGMEENLNKSFHELTEYFVKTLDYEDTEGIFLAYELHKATLQEHYNLEQIIKDYEVHKEERSRFMAESSERNENYGNLFSLTEEEEEYEAMQNHTTYEEYEVSQKADFIREENGWWKSWRKTPRRLRKKRWGSWDDLILETDGQVEDSHL